MNELQREKLKTMSAQSQAWADLRQHFETIEKVADGEIEGNEMLIRKVFHIVAGDMLAKGSDA